MPPNKPLERRSSDDSRKEEPTSSDFTRPVEKLEAGKVEKRQSVTDDFFRPPKVENRPSSSNELNTIKTELQGIREKVSAKDLPVGELGKLLKKTQDLHDTSTRVAPGDSSLYKETQEMKDTVQAHFFQASTDTYRDVYKTDIEAGYEFPEFERNFIGKYTKTDADEFYRLTTKIKGEYTNSGEDKKTGVNYYSPEDRMFINYSNSRTDEMENLKPLHENETEKERYQRTLPHSEMLHHLRHEAINEYNQEHSTRISPEEKMPDMTFVRHSLSNKEYIAVAPQLNIAKGKQETYNPGDAEFSLLMKEVPNFKGVGHFLAQHHPHLEVTSITIMSDRYDSAIVRAQTRESL